MKKKYKINNVILGETKNLMGSFTFVQDESETGRSMVEMLGVLAIIGVLSVGGIAGYTSAMRQYRANEIVNATSMLYMIGASQNQGTGDKQMLYSGALGTVPSGVSEITYNAGKTITLAFTDTDVCPLVKNKLGDKATGECPNLTVSFEQETGEVTEEEEEEEFTGYEEPCKSNEKYACDRSNIYICSSGKWVQAPLRCDGDCTDHKPHDNKGDTCIGSVYEM